MVQLIDSDHGRPSSQESMEYFRHNTSKARAASVGFSGEMSTIELSSQLPGVHPNLVSD